MATSNETSGCNMKKFIKTTYDKREVVEMENLKLFPSEERLFLSTTITKHGCPQKPHPQPLFTCSTSILTDSLLGSATHTQQQERLVAWLRTEQWQHSENSYNTSAMASAHDSDSRSDSAQLALSIALWKMLCINYRNVSKMKDIL